MTTSSSSSPFPKDLKGGFTLGQPSGRISSVALGGATSAIPQEKEGDKEAIYPAPMTVTATLVATPSPVAEPVRVQPVQPVQPDAVQIMHKLIDAPSKIAEAQKLVDDAGRLYAARLSILTIKAFSEALFPGKKEGEGLRPASNDTEREAAIQSLITSDPVLEGYAQAREAALRELTRLRGEFEAFKLVMQYLISK